jgi:hypothetical protein
LLDFFILDGDSSSDDDEDDASLSLFSLVDFVLVDFVAETALFEESLARFFTARVPVADFARTFFTVT